MRSFHALLQCKKCGGALFGDFETKTRFFQVFEDQQPYQDCPEVEQTLSGPFNSFIPLILKAFLKDRIINPHLHQMNLDFIIILLTKLKVL
jgi:hypothetical protein